MSLKPLRVGTWSGFGMAAALAVLTGLPAHAAPLRPEDVPPALKPWVPWALAGHETAFCLPLSKGTPGLCPWSGRLAIIVDARGGRFTQTWQVEAEAEVPLPGSRDHWPLDVRAGARKLVVLERDAGPVVLLPRGLHQLSGTFVWPRPPEVLPVPASTGLLSLSLGGREVVFPRRTEEGHLFLATGAPSGEPRPEAEADTLELSVHRKLTDEVPLVLTTQIDLAVTGKPREVLLAAPLPAGFVAQALESRLPTRIEPDGKLRVQLRPGQHTVTLIARAPNPPTSITRPRPEGLWKSGDEIWAFEARPALRLVTVSGVAPVDPRQSKLPDEWRSLPAYLVPPGATLRLEHRRRGDAEPAPDRLSLRRRFWLDFDGGGYTVRDELSGRLERSSRLEMGPEQALGRFVVDGADQPITVRGPGQPAGVEVRALDLSAVAEGRIEGTRRNPPTVGWAHDFQSVEATLALPPGWRLLHVGGADRVGDSFVRRLSLLDLFLVLVVALGAGRLFGFKVGLLAFAVMALLTKETGAPTWIWLAVLVGEALVRGLPAGYLRKTAKVYRLSITLALVVLAFPFALTQVNRAIHPGLPGEAEDVSDRFLQTAGYGAEPSAVAEEPARPGRPSAEARLRRQAKAGREQKKQIEPEESDEGVEGGVAGGVAGGMVGGSLGGLSALGAPPPPPAAPKPAAENTRLADYDPNAEIQTGPGIPRWRWTEVGLGWNGPVEKGARLSLWLVPPWLGTVLGVLRVLLMGIFIVLLLRGALASFRRYMPPVVAALVLWALAPAPAVAQELPPKALIEELRARLTEPPACHPRCASFGRLHVEAAPDRLRLRLEADALAPAAVALPGLAQQWSPAAVSVDGRPATALHRDGEGRLWLLLAPGTHQLILEGPPGNRPSVQIAFGELRPHVVTTSLRGFALVGVAEDGAIRDSLELVRGPGAGGAPVAEDDSGGQSLPPFVFVERTLALGLEWRVHTEIVRGSPPGSAVVTEIALLPGESVLTAGIKVANGKVQVNMGPGESRTGWSSVLVQRSPITLKAPAASEGASGGSAEVWRLDAGPLWSVSTTGIAPAHPEPGAGRRVHLWRPWPGESVTVAITRPTGPQGQMKGQTVTFDASALELRPGVRSTDARLSLMARTSRGVDHALTLPEGATLTALSVDGTEQPVRQEGRKVVVSLAPGSQRIELGFRTTGGLGPLTRAPQVDLGAPSVNADVALHLATDRWILWTFGPPLGPAVLLPSLILVVLLIGLVLGRARVLPIGTHQFVLLGLGFLPLSPAAGAAVLGYLVALSWRRTHLRTSQGWLYDLVQVLLGMWTVLAIAILFLVVREGLLSTPDMDVVGNGSSPSQLRWTLDRSEGLTPRTGVISLPLGAYHLTMLAWALWLAVAVIRWSPWVWSCLTAGGLWRPLFTPRLRPPEPPPSGATTEREK